MRVDPDLLARSIKGAKSKGFLTIKDWGNYKTEKGISVADHCCFVLPLKEAGKAKPIFQFYCIADPKLDCQSEVEIWVDRINSFVNRLKYIDDFTFLMILGKGAIDCTTTRELGIIKKRMVNVYQFMTEVCFIVKMNDPKYKDADCEKDTTDEISEETRQLSQNTKIIQDVLERCIISGEIPVKSDPLAA